MSRLLPTTLALLALATPAGAQPADGRVVWASNRLDGRHEIYAMRADGGELKRLTFKGGKVPAWSPDGRWIAYFNTADQATHVLKHDGSEDRSLCADAPAFDMTPLAFWRHDGQLVCLTREADSDQGYRATDPDSGASTLLFKKSDFKHVKGCRFEPGGITSDGRWLLGWAIDLFKSGYAADNGTFTSAHATVALALSDRSRIYYVGAGCLAATPPAGDLVYHVSRDSDTMPDIYRLSINDLAKRSSYALELGYPDAELGHEYMPAVSNDSQWLVYAASLGCHNWYDCDYEIFVHRLGAGPKDRVRLTTDPANDNFPSLFVGEPGRPRPDLGVQATDAAVPRPDRGGTVLASGGGCTTGGSPAASPIWILALVLCRCARRRSRRDQ